MKSEEFRKNGHALVDWMADYMDSVENLDVRSQVKPGDILSVLDDEPPVTYGARRHRVARARTPAARASRVPRATSRVTPATGKRSNPPPQQQQGRPYLRTHVRTRDVA